MTITTEKRDLFTVPHEYYLEIEVIYSDSICM